MAMSTVHRKTLHRTLEVLAEDMDVIPAIIHLKSKEILGDLDEERINAKATEKEKVMEFIKLTKKRGKRAYPVLKEYLQQCQGSEHLAEELERNLKDVELELQGLTMEIDGRKQIDKWNVFEEKIHYFNCIHESIDQYQNIPGEINILLIGKTGSGKSATGNTLIGKPFFEALVSSGSVTKTISKKVIKEDRFKITIIDTPGLFDTAKDIQNEDLVLEIAKTMVNFKCGIHLFLLVCGSTRFTREEQETIEVIEKILTKNIYNNCVVVLTNANAQFGGSSKDSLRDYVKRENGNGLEFANLLKQVNNRILAVENCFEDEFLVGKQRQEFLCCLAQVIHDNKGSVYSNKAFDRTRKRVEQLEGKRKKRISIEKDKNNMRICLRKYLLHKYLASLSVKDLEGILPISEKTTQYIMLHSGVNQLQCATARDVQQYLELFITENGPLIDKMKQTKIKKSRQRQYYKSRRKKLRKEEDTYKMQRTVLPFVSKYLQEQSKEQLLKLIENKELPAHEMSQIIECLESPRLKPTQIKYYIRKTVFDNPNEIQRCLDDKIVQEYLAEQSKKLLRDQKIQSTVEILEEKLPKVIEGKRDTELQQLKTDLCLFKTNAHITPNLETLFNKIVGNDIENCNINISEISKLYLDQNCNFIQSVLETMLTKRYQEADAEKHQKREELRISTLGILSEIIRNKLKSYLTGKTTNELNDLVANISKGEVPSDIFVKISSHLTAAQKRSLNENELKSEIVRQIKEQNEVFEECRKEAGQCFAGSTEVRIKGSGICKISNVKVDDEILVYDENGYIFYDKVYLIAHAKEEEHISFIRLQTSAGKKLFISSCHLLPLGTLYSNVPANDVSLGDVIFTLHDGVMMSDIVTSISYEVCRGAYCPMTMNGTIVVNDVAASCYTTFFPSRLAHALLTPIRLLFNYLPMPLFEKLLPYDEEEGMPMMLLKCHSMINMWRSLSNCVH